MGKSTELCYNHTMTQSRRAELTAREIEVLTLIARGYTNRHIAAELCISVSTVNSHVQNIYTALGAVNRSHAVAIFARFLK